MIEIPNRLFERLVFIQFIDKTELVCHLFEGDYSEGVENINVISPFELPKYLQKRFAVHLEKNTRLTNFEKYTVKKKRIEILKIELATYEQMINLINKLKHTLD